MRKQTILNQAGFLGLLLTMGAGAATAAELTVTISGVKNAEGNVRVALYDRKDGFRKEENAIQLRQLPARAGDLTVQFNDLAAGRYAVIAYHDEDGNGDLNRFLGMIPTEGYGLSNNPKLSGPPKFDEAAVTLPAEGMAIQLQLNY